MRKLGLAACLALVSGVACAGSIEIPINGGVGRLHVDERCTDRLCGTASWTDGDTGQTFEFALPSVTWKDLEALSGGGMPNSARPRRKVEKPEKSKKTASPQSAPTAPPASAQSVPAMPSAPVQSSAAPTSSPPATTEVARAEPPASVAPPPATSAPPAEPVAAPTRSAAVPPQPSANTPATKTPATAALAPPRVSTEPAKPETRQAEPASEQRVAAIPPSAPAPAPVPAAAPPAAGPIGVWMTENQEGMVRVEPCGQAICGYEYNGRTQQNGKKVLIDMRPAGKSWKGRIHDPRGGGTYDSTVSMKGSNAMRVEGCAFGGLFCGGQTWTRAN